MPKLLHARLASSAAALIHVSMRSRSVPISAMGIGLFGPRAARLVAFGAVLLVDRLALGGERGVDGEGIFRRRQLAEEVVELRHAIFEPRAALQRQFNQSSWPRTRPIKSWGWLGIPGAAPRPSAESMSTERTAGVSQLQLR